jgi:hypothetical protein
VLEWVLSAISGLYLAVAGVVSLLWRLLHPSPDASTAALPDLHQVRTVPISACSQRSNSQAADHERCLHSHTNLDNSMFDAQLLTWPLQALPRSLVCVMPHATYASNILCSRGTGNKRQLQHSHSSVGCSMQSTMSCPHSSTVVGNCISSPKPTPLC